MNNHEERTIQSKIMYWCREQGLIVNGTANGQYLSTWSARKERATLGRGLPDLFIRIPATRSITGQPVLIGCEVKAAKGKATKEQIEFINFINSIQGDIHGFIAHSLKEAKDYIAPLLKDKEPVKDLEKFINEL